MVKNRSTHSAENAGKLRVPEAFLRLYVKLQVLKSALLDEKGQDLIEYALVVALIALGAVASMSGVANAIRNAFTKIGSKLGTYTN
jgi:pilus assembly protein Flp/PilA